MSLTKHLKEILEYGEIEDRYLAVCFLVSDPADLEDYAWRYGLSLRKLERYHHDRSKRGDVFTGSLQTAEALYKYHESDNLSSSHKDTQ